MRHDDGKGQQATGGTTRRRRFDDEWDDDGKQEARERRATYPRQQSTHADTWGGEETREGDDCGG